MENVCIHCHATDVPMAYIEGRTIHCCHHCGTVFIQDHNLMLTVDTEIESPLYSIARGIAEIYKLYRSLDNVPMPE